MNYRRGFDPLILLFIAALLIGGTFLFPKKTVQAPTIAGNATSTAQTSDWMTYTNKGQYVLQYPPTARIVYNTQTCLEIQTSEYGMIFISSRGDNCGARTGFGIGDYRVNDTVLIDGKSYDAHGWGSPDGSSDFYLPTIGDITVAYGVVHTDTSDPSSWKYLGPLSQAEYTRALNSAKAILSTLTVQ